MPFDFRLPADLEAFRRRVADFLAVEMATVTPADRDRADLTGLTEGFERTHQRRAGAEGFLGISAPVDYGGGGRPLSYQAVYQFEAAYHDAPSIDTAWTLCSAPLVSFGSDGQRQQLLPAMIAGQLTGCIAYSEASAGSDLAAVETMARRIPGGWSLSGAKTLVTGAHKADICVTVARTDPEAPTRSALSMFVFSLPRPGVTVRRRPTVNGWTLSEIDFDAVELDAGHLLGVEGAGWSQLGAALAQERSGMFHLGWATRLRDELAAWLTASRPPGPAPGELVAIDLDLAAGLRLATSALFCQDRGRLAPHQGAAIKTFATELLQRMAGAASELVGLEALSTDGLFATSTAPLGGRLGWEVLERIHGTIGAGVNEVQRDFIARAGLSLPRPGR